MRQTIHPSPKPPIFCDRGLMVNQNLAGLPIGTRVDHTLPEGTIEVWQDGKRIGRIAGIGEKPAQEPTCTWTEDEDGVWLSCYPPEGGRNGFTFEWEGPAENDFKFCPYCGKPLVVGKEARNG